jgi:hypothetical protein
VSLTVEQTLAPETQLAGYRIGALVSAVAGRAVYRATDAASGRAVRIETFPTHAFRSDAEREGYKSGVLETAALHHPVLLPVSEVGDHAGLLFLVSHDVPTDSLAQLMGRSRRLGYLRAARIVNRVGEALDVLHRRGIAHGAVMPSNVLLDRRDRVVLAGVGQPPAPDDRLRLPTGMLDYTAPERLSGEVTYPTTEQDLYALGCVLYSAATGSAPFAEHQSPEAKVQAHLSEAPVPPSRRVVGLTSDCDAVVARALAKDPSERFQSAYELGAAALGAAKGRLMTHWERTVAAGATAPTTLVLEGTNGGSTTIPERPREPDLRAEREDPALDVPPASDPPAPPEDSGPADSEATAVRETWTDDYESSAPIEEPVGEPFEEPDLDATPADEGDAAEATVAADPPAADDQGAVHETGYDETTDLQPADHALAAEPMPFASATPPLSAAPKRRRRSRSRVLVRTGAALVGVAALVGALAAGGVFDGGNDGSSTGANRASAPSPAAPETSTPAPAPVEPAPAADPNPPAEKPSKPVALKPWPAGRDAYTVVVFVTTGDRARARSSAREAGRVVQPAGLLDSSAHPPLPPGHIVAYAGRFSSQPAALRAAERIRAAGVAGRPYVRRIRG